MFLKSYIVQYLFCLKDLAAKLQSQLDKARKLKDSGAQAEARKSDEVRDMHYPAFILDYCHWK